MARSASIMTTTLAGALVIIATALPAVAGGGHAYDYDDDINCYEVTKVYEHYGRPALFGGTQCRDHYGDRWIVDGSRYLIRYLDEYDDYDHHRLDRIPDDEYYDRR